MSSFGITATGIVVKDLEQILSELEDDQRAAFGPAINTTPASVMGQLNSIFGDKVAEMWELAAAVYASQYADTAQDASLDNVGAITGAERLAATKSTVPLRVNLDPGIILNIGRVVSVSVTGERFVTTEQVSNTTGVAANIPVEAESEEFGAILGSTGTIDTIETPVVGWTAEAAIDSANVETFALSNGQTLVIEVDGGAEQTVTFITGDFVSLGAALAAEVAAAITANTTGLSALDVNGAVRIVSDTDGVGSSIQVTGGSSNPQLGFSTTLVAGINDSDAALGRDIESNQAFRIRREELLRISGAATLEAIRAALINTTDVIQAFVFENTTLITDANGLPGKAIEAVVEGGTDLDVAQTLFDSKSAGIETYRDPGAGGVGPIGIIDSQGESRAINFSRPTDVPMFVNVYVTVDSTLFGGGDQDAGEQQVKDVISVLGQQQQIGQDVVILRYKSAPLPVAGVYDVTLIEVEDTSSPTNTENVEIDIRDLASFDTGDMNVIVQVL